ncbi:MAG: hypothetical protein O3A00_12720 [Planctomycetota bacterium]|nr:hypothetical protein [Planctomycetota bacterium]
MSRLLRPVVDDGGLADEYEVVIRGGSVVDGTGTNRLHWIFRPPRVAG